MRYNIKAIVVDKISKMKKQGFLIVVAVATVFLIAIAAFLFSINVPLDNELVKMSYFTGIESPDIYWIDLIIYENGESDFVTFMNHQIFVARHGNLVQQEVESLIDFIEEMRFYEMLERYEHENELPCDGELTSISVKHKSVVAHCSLAPDSFYDIRDELIEVGKNLTHVQRGVFIRTEKLDTKRIEKVRERFDFISLSGKLDEYPFLKQAVDEPDHFVYIEGWDNTEIERFVLKEYDYFFIEVNNEYYQVNVFYTDE